MADILAWIVENSGDVLWGFCAIVSIVLTTIGAINAYKRYKNATHTRYVLNPVHLFTIFVFGAMFLMMIPVTCLYEDLGEKFIYFRPLLMAFNYTMRAFILDGGFADTIGGVLEKLTPEEKNRFVYLLVTVWGTVLYVLAPALTFVNVMSIFKNLMGELRYKWVDRRKCYIFSELNAKSVALAKSIRGKDTKGHIVFTDVFEQNDEPDFELLLEARNMRAICMKKDIAHVDLLERKGSVEVFLIGDNESENISQAVKITTELDRQNKKQDVKIFVFSRQKSGAYIIDSLNYQNLLEHAKKQDFDEQTFKLRRINEVQQLVWNTVPEMDVFALAEKNGGEIPVLIAGMGSYGMEFFKMLIWFCQFEGVRLRLTVVDKRPKGAVEAMIRRECPDLLKRNRLEEEGESFYDVEIIPDVDVETDALENLINYDQDDGEKIRLRQRLRQTKIAIVGLGNDDLNIETAVYLRSLFDRIHGVVAYKEDKKTKTVTKITSDEEPVKIYSVVYDEQKSGILHRNDDAESDFLRNHQDVPYHINFIGAMSSQFSYENIYDEGLEKAALAHHTFWANLENMLEKKAQYEQYEYFRQSSMATELYNREVMEVPPMKKRTTCLQPVKSAECECAECTVRKRSEHMRWNAYMRVCGFSYGEPRADRAMLHNDLKPWKKLSDKEREKDAGLSHLAETE